MAGLHRTDVLPSREPRIKKKCLPTFESFAINTSDNSIPYYRLVSCGMIHPHGALHYDARCSLGTPVDTSKKRYGSCYNWPFEFHIGPFFI